MTSKSDPFGNRTGIGVGITTLVTILVVLLLTTFSIMTLASARYDYRLSTLTADATAGYYAADREACRWVAEVKTIIENRPQAEWSEAVLSTEENVSVQRIDDAQAEALIVYCEFEIDTNLMLEVRVVITGNGELTIIDWVSVSRA